MYVYNKLSRKDNYVQCGVLNRFFSINYELENLN